MRLLLIGSFLIISNLVNAQQHNCQSSCSNECKRIAKTIIDNCGPVTPIFQNVVIYSGFGCTGSALASVTSDSDCEVFKASSGRYEARSYQFGTNCNDLNTVSIYETCHLYKAASNQNAVSVYTRLGCEKRDLRAFIDSNSNCQIITAYGGGEAAVVRSSIKMNVCKQVGENGPFKYGINLSKYCQTVKSGGF